MTLPRQQLHRQYPPPASRARRRPARSASAMALLRRTAGVLAGASGGALLSLAPLHWSPGFDGPSALGALPVSSAARVGAGVAALPLPRAARAPLLRAYADGDAALAGCGPPAGFRSLAAFWARRREGAGAGGGGAGDVVAACDGVVVAVGVVGDRGVMPVPEGAGEGLEWSVRGLLAAEDRDRLSVAEEAGVFELTAVVIHLDPRRDSYRLRSPAEWVVRERRDVRGGGGWLEAPGELAYVRNRRAPWVGDWEHGMFSMTAVGGPGAGEVVTLDDEEALGGKGGAGLDRGAEIGCLRVGSALVLVFEAPVGAFKPYVAPGARVLAGERLGRVELANAKGAAAPAESAGSTRKPVSANAGRRLRRSW